MTCSCEESFPPQNSRECVSCQDGVEEALAALPVVDATRIAAVGYCLETALQLTYTGADLKAVATFHSSLPTPTDAEAKSIQAKLLVCSGGADQYIPQSQVREFRSALTVAGVNLHVVIYDGVLHSFTSPAADRVGNPAMKYDKDADQDSWRRMTQLFEEALGM